MHQCMLSDKVVMRERCSLWQSSRATTEEPCCRRALSSLLVVESYPVFLAMLHDILVGSEAFRYSLLLRVEDPDIGLWNLAFIRCFEYAIEDFWLYNDEFCL